MLFSRSSFMMSGLLFVWGENSEHLVYTDQDTKKKERKGNNLRWSTFSLSLDCTKWFFNIKMSAFVAFVQFGRSALAMTSQGHTHGVIRGLELLNCFLLRSGVRRILPGFRVTGFHWSEFDQCFISHHIQSLLSHRRVFFSLKLIKI